MRSKSIVLNRDDLQQARENLARAGFQVETAPPEMLECGVVLVAFRETDGEGYLLTAPEVRLVALYGLAALDPHRDGDTRPRWQREDSRNRERAYIEAAIAKAVAEVASAPVGNRNNTLSRVAYSLGGLEHLGLDRERVQQELEQAALAAGLSLQEARPTIRRGLEAGSREPRELPADLGHSIYFGHSGVTKIKSAPERKKRFWSLVKGGVGETPENG